MYPTRKNKENPGKSGLLQPVRIVDLVNYQKGSVVSRAIINKKAGNVTLFSFDKGEGLSEHTAPYDALVFVIDGQAEVTVSGKVSALQTGEMILMPSNKPHALKAVEQFKMLLIMVQS